MKQTRTAFTHDALLRTVKKAVEEGLKKIGIKDDRIMLFPIWIALWQALRFSHLNFLLC